MAFIYCEDCGWGQDDFWDKNGYNPFRQDIVDDLKENLFRDKIHMDSQFIEEHKIPFKRDEKGPYVRGTDLVATELERTARSVRNMCIRTSEEWDQVRDSFVCPKCGSKKWGID